MTVERIAIAPWTATVIHTMSAKPAVVFVHGTGHSPECFEKVQSLLLQRAYIVRCPALPSCGPQLLGIADDAACVRDAVVSLADDRRAVVLVMHSYGGIPGTQVSHESIGQC